MVTRISSRIGHLAESGYSPFQSLGSLIPWTLTVRLQSWGRGEGVRSFALGLEQKTCLGVARALIYLQNLYLWLPERRGPTLGSHPLGLSP